MNNFEKTIFDQLRQEHQELREILAEAENCSVLERDLYLGKIEINLVPHSRGEEKTLYSLTRLRVKSQDLKESLLLTNESYEDHHLADKILAEMKSINNRSERWIPLLRLLKENLERHMQEEEDELFSIASALFSKDEQAILLNDYLEARERYIDTLPTQRQIDERVPSHKTQEDFGKIAAL